MMMMMVLWVFVVDLRNFVSGILTTRRRCRKLEHLISHRALEERSTKTKFSPLLTSIFLSLESLIFSLSRILSQIVKCMVIWSFFHCVSLSGLSLVSTNLLVDFICLECCSDLSSVSTVKIKANLRWSDFKIMEKTYFGVFDLVHWPKKKMGKGMLGPVAWSDVVVRVTCNGGLLVNCLSRLYEIEFLMVPFHLWSKFCFVFFFLVVPKNK